MSQFGAFALYTVEPSELASSVVRVSSMPTFAQASRNSWAAATSTDVDSMAISRKLSCLPSFEVRTLLPLSGVVPGRVQDRLGLGRVGVELLVGRDVEVPLAEPGGQDGAAGQAVPGQRDVDQLLAVDRVAQRVPNRAGP